MPEPQRDYYDQWYKAGLALKESAHHALLYDHILCRIPADASRILDAGCGDGAIVDRLPRRECTVGIDFSLEALRRVRSVVACSSIEALCFPDHSFDLVIATEVLEHLTARGVELAARELARVSSRHAIISVPNRERLRFSRSTCPACASSLNAHGHMQRFDPQRLASLLPRFEMCEVLEVGADRLDFPAWLIKLRRLFGGEHPLAGGRTCLVCGYVAPEARRSSSADRSRRRKQSLAFLARSRPSWLVAVYVKTDGARGD